MKTQDGQPERWLTFNVKKALLKIFEQEWKEKSSELNLALLKTETQKTKFGVVVVKKLHHLASESQTYLMKYNKAMKALEQPKTCHFNKETGIDPISKKDF